MRPLLKYGIPAAAALGVGGSLLMDDDTSGGQAILGGLAGGLGAAAGLKGARLAGKYAPQVAEALQAHVLTPAGNLVGDLASKIPQARNSGLRSTLAGNAAAGIENMGAAISAPGNVRTLRKIAAGAGVPAAAGLAGIGGVALGAIPGAMGVPGFQYNPEELIDPEGYGSSNSAGARYKATTLSPQYY